MLILLQSDVHKESSDLRENIYEQADCLIKHQKPIQKYV